MFCKYLKTYSQRVRQTETENTDSIDIDHIEPNKAKEWHKEALLELIWQSWRTFSMTFKSKPSF